MVHFCVYEVSNIVDGLGYVGCTTDEMQERWKAHVTQAHLPKDLVSYAKSQGHVSVVKRLSDKAILS